MKIRIIPEQEYLKECFYYNEFNGELTYLLRPLYHFPRECLMRMWNTKFSNKLAGSKHHIGYIIVTLDSISYQAHRLIWKLYYGTEPATIIDHINGDKSDNRICNLREATPTENSRNRTKATKHSKSGYLGVHYCKRDDRWIATIQINKKKITIGRFKTMQEAVKARKERAKQEFGEFYNDFND